MSRTSRRRQASFSGKSPPRKPKNADVRPREYLSEEEVHRLIQAAKGVGRYGHRDAALILLTYRHGLRVSEVIALQWAVIDLRQGRLHVHRLKDGIPAVHPLRGPEIRALRRLERESPSSPYVFVSERGSPLSDSAVRKVVARAGCQAGLEFPVHPHMLRHATGYKLANDGHACACDPALPWSQEHPAHGPLSRSCLRRDSRTFGETESRSFPWLRGHLQKNSFRGQNCSCAP